jgi:aspartyl-tRNA(Asn)/glutamyl-tRNA(Gln) amidotransferase subunit A
VSPEALHSLSARRIAAAVAGGELSAEEVTRHHLDRIEEHAHLNTVITSTREQALARARAKPTGTLAGVPLLVKDVFDTAGVRTTYGSGIFRDNVPLRSATSVRRLLDAGAIMLGKANLHEFAWGVTSRNRAYGAVVNSARPDRIPGGSSGGNASALAAGLCALGLGTDTGASIRLPAAACGVAGLKPAFGSVPADGLWPLAPSFDHVGPLARSFDDCVLAFGVLRGAPLAERDPAGLRVRQLDAPALADTTEAFLAAAGLPAAPALVRLHLAEAAEVHREIYASHRDDYDDDLHAKLAVGLSVAPAERAELVNALCAWRAAAASGCDWDVLVSPVYPGDLPLAGVPMSMELTDRMTAYTRPINWLGWPSAVTADGVMHTGLDESAVLAHARAWESQ